MFEFEITRSTCQHGECPCEEAYNDYGTWYVSFNEMKELLDFIARMGDAIITQNGKCIHILDEE